MGRPIAAGVFGRPPRPLIRDLIIEASKQTGFSYKDLVGRSRGFRSQITPVRHRIWWQARLTGRTYSEIGRAFGNRHHSTILHGIRQVGG